MNDGPWPKPIRVFLFSKDTHVEMEAVPIYSEDFEIRTLRDIGKDAQRPPVRHKTLRRKRSPRKDRQEEVLFDNA